MHRAGARGKSRARQWVDDLPGDGIEARLSTMGGARLAKTSILAAAILVWALWLLGMQAGARWPLLAEAWFMSITMAVGSFIAGATAEGGGAVAFPVMTLMFAIPPPVARDFALMIQSVGMTSASATILYTRIPIEPRALWWSGLGGVFGVVAGIEWISPRLPPAYTKMTFLAVWLAFAGALFLINRHRDREVRPAIERFRPRHGLMLVATGLVGGAISGLTGSGLDILTFALLTLRFRVCETIATPTSVVLMASNALVGFAWKATFGGGMEQAAWAYWWACVPIVVVGAPLGARFIRDRSRLFVASILYVSIAIQFVAGILIIPQTTRLAGYTVLVLGAALLGFHWMARGGMKRLVWLSSSPPEHPARPHRPRDADE